MSQRVPFQAALLLVSALGFAACGEPPTDPMFTENPLFKKGGEAVCPVPANVVVTDEAGLLAALAAAGPGDVIGLDGLIELTTSMAVVATDDVTLTCATAGSGLFGDAGGGDWLVWVTGNRVAVDRLVLDGRQLTSVFPTAYRGEGEELSFSNNIVRCSLICAWFEGALAPAITDNSFDSSDPMFASFSAIQIQSGTTQALVMRNTVVGSGTTGIRIRSGVEHTVNDNTVSGAWRSSIGVISGVVPLTGTEIESNRLDGAVNFGLELGGRNAMLVATGNLVRKNKIKGAGQAGVSVDWACGNTFQQNNLSANDVGLIFHESTGSNTYTGNKNVVVDDGDFDCDGDGVPDPNRGTFPDSDCQFSQEGVHVMLLNHCTTTNDLGIELAPGTKFDGNKHTITMEGRVGIVGGSQFGGGGSYEVKNVSVVCSEREEPPFSAGIILYGTASDDRSQITVEHVRVSGCLWGIQIAQTTHGSKVSHNYVDVADRGIRVLRSDNVEVDHNEVVGADEGILLDNDFGDVVYTRVSHNTLIGTATPCVDTRIPRLNTWDHNKNLSGNLSDPPELCPF